MLAFVALENERPPVNRELYMVQAARWLLRNGDTLPPELQRFSQDAEKEQIFDQERLDRDWSPWTPRSKLPPTQAYVRDILQEMMTRFSLPHGKPKMMFDPGVDRDAASQDIDVLPKTPETSPAHNAAKEPDPQVTDDMEAAQEPPSSTVPAVLNGVEDSPIVLGKPKKRLTPARFNVVTTLLNSPVRLSKDELDQKSGYREARKILKGLANSDPDWASVILFPDSPGVGYGIRRLRGLLLTCAQAPGLKWAAVEAALRRRLPPRGTPQPYD